MQIGWKRVTRVEGLLTGGGPWSLIPEVREQQPTDKNKMGTRDMETQKGGVWLGVYLAGKSCPRVNRISEGNASQGVVGRVKGEKKNDFKDPLQKKVEGGHAQSTWKEI